MKIMITGARGMLGRTLCPIEVFVGGKPVSKDRLSFHRSAGSLIVQFPLATAPRLSLGCPERTRKLIGSSF